MKTLNDELARAIRNRRYEHTEDGRVLFPDQQLFVGGVFRTDVNGKDVRILPNVFTKEGLIYVLSTSFQGKAQTTAFYLAPFLGDVAPDGNALTGANFAATQSEFTAYDEATRVPWVLPTDPITAASLDNSASVATFSINADNSTVWGFALLTAAAKSAVTGKCIACFKDATARDNLRNGDKLNIQYAITAADAG